jgi:predicted DNA-binding protein
MSRKIPISFALDLSQLEKLDELSKRTNLPKSVFVRRALDRFFTEEFDAQMKLFPAPQEKTQATS